MLEKTVRPKEAGDAVSDFSLRATNGETYTTHSVRQSGLILVALFKSGCGTCRYAFPYLQRFQAQYAEKAQGAFQIWGVSQDNAETTRAFAKEQGANFPLLLDEMLQVSEDYAITNVPCLYLLDARDEIADAVVGHFSAEGYNRIAKRIAQFLEVPYTPIVKEADAAPALKPG